MAEASVFCDRVQLPISQIQVVAQQHDAVVFTGILHYVVILNNTNSSKKKLKKLIKSLIAHKNFDKIIVLITTCSIRFSVDLIRVSTQSRGISHHSLTSAILSIDGWQLRPDFWLRPSV